MVCGILLLLCGFRLVLGADVPARFSGFHNEMISTTDGEDISVASLPDSSYPNYKVLP